MAASRSIEDRAGAPASSAPAARPGPLPTARSWTSPPRAGTGSSASCATSPASTARTPNSVGVFERLAEAALAAHHQQMIRNDQVVPAMVLYGLGFMAMFALLGVLYATAWRR